MNFVIRHIEYLISRNECVIIPGLGAILACRQSARLDMDQMVMYAPHRIFSFNPSLKKSDGTLACSIARSKSISYEEACSIVSEEVEMMNRQLRLQGEFPLGRIGNLFLTEGADVPEFQPYPNDCLSVDTAWLPSVDLASTAAEEEEENVIEPTITPLSPFARFIRIAASIALLVCLCFIASTPISVNDAALASLTPQLKQVSPETFMPSDPQEVLSITATSTNPKGIAMEIKNSQNPQLTAPKYCLVIGSFYSADEAQKFIKSKGNDNLAIMESNGKYRVYSSTFNTDEEACRALKDNPGTWICRMSK